MAEDRGVSVSFPFKGGAPDQPLRLALISTPRSGTTWVRLLLTQIYQLDQIVVHRPRDFDWSELPQRCIVHAHVAPSPGLLEKLAASALSVITLARHPLDILISHLQFAQHRSAPWTQTLKGATPTSERFIRFATSANNVGSLSLSRDWWQVAGVLKLRYEHLVADPTHEMESLARRLGHSPVNPISEAVRQTSLDRLIATERRRGHYWQGRPGLWRSLLPAVEARLISEAHHQSLEFWGYTVDPDPVLTTKKADRMWNSLAISLPNKGLGRRVAARLAATAAPVLRRFGA